MPEKQSQSQSSQSQSQPKTAQSAERDPFMPDKHEIGLSFDVYDPEEEDDEDEINLLGPMNMLSKPYDYHRELRFMRYNPKTDKTKPIVGKAQYPYDSDSDDDCSSVSSDEDAKTDAYQVPYTDTKHISTIDTSGSVFSNSRIIDPIFEDDHEQNDPV